MRYEVRDIHGDPIIVTPMPMDRIIPQVCVEFQSRSEENEDVVERVVKKAAGRFEVLEMRRRTPGIDAGDGFFAAVIESS